MVRGRSMHHVVQDKPMYLTVQDKRVVMLLAIFGLLFVVNTPLVPAQEKTIFFSTMVQPSLAWIHAIGDYSLVQLNTQSVEILKPVKITVISRGLLEQILVEQKMKITVYLNKNVYQESILASGQNGIAGFAFVPTKYGDYRVVVENTTYSTSVTLHELTFSIHDLSQSSFVRNILDLLPKINISF